MTSETGSPARGMPRRIREPARTGHAFTLVEILLVLALLGLMAGAAMLAAGSLLRNGSDDGREIAWEVIQNARNQAVLTGETAWLRVGEDEESLMVRALGGETVRTLPSGVAAEIHPEGGTERTDLSAKHGSRPGVRFYRDGTCDGFQLRLKSSRRAAPITLSIDPWTCAPALAHSGT